MTVEQFTQYFIDLALEEEAEAESSPLAA